MVRSFRDKDTERVFSGRRVRRLPEQIVDRAEAKLRILDQVAEVEELRVPPGNKLEKLSGDREGQWSIRINRQYRICFGFDDEVGNAYDVEITDYH